MSAEMGAGNGPAPPPTDEPWPTSLEFDAPSAQLSLAFDDGFEATIPFELLRVESPSAETRGHGDDRPPPPAGKRKIVVTAADPVGRYAVRIHFNDGHDTGLYTWAYLRELAEGKEARMAAYLKRLAAAGRSRDPA